MNASPSPAGPEDSFWDVLNLDLFFVKDAVKRTEAKTSDRFDIFDPVRQQVVLVSREPDINSFVKLARLTGGNHDEGTPFNYVVTLAASGQPVLRIRRASATLTLGGPPVEVFDQEDKPICKIKKKQLAWGQKFRFYHPSEKEIFILQLKPRWGGCDLFVEGKKLAMVGVKLTPEQAEFFKAQKCGYTLAFAPDLPRNNPIRQLLLSFVLARSRMVLKSTIPF